MSGTRYIHAEKLLRFDPKVHVSYCNLWEYSYHTEAPLVFIQCKTLYISNRLLLTLLAHRTKDHESILTQHDKSFSETRRHNELLFCGNDVWDIL